MIVKKMVFVLILRDQNGMAAEVFPEISLVKKRVREIIEHEFVSSMQGVDVRWKKEKQRELKRLLAMENVVHMVESYEEGKHVFRTGDSSERMWVLESPYIE